MKWEWTTTESLVDLLRKREEELHAASYQMEHPQRKSKDYAVVVRGLAYMLHDAANQLLEERAITRRQIVAEAQARVSLENERTLKIEYIKDLARWKEQNAVLWTEILRLRAREGRRYKDIPRTGGARAYHEEG